MSRKSRWEYFRAVYPRYQKASQEMKQIMLDEFCSNTGYNRKYAIRLLNGAPPEQKPRLRRRRSASYGARLIRLLTVVWEAAGYPWSVRLKAVLPLWLPWIRKRLRLDAATEEMLLRISAATMGSALEVEKGIVDQEALRGNQARHSAEASYSHQDGFLERERSGFCGGGLGIALGELR